MFGVTNHRSTPVPISNMPQAKQETDTTYTHFDPFASSPPNDFLRKLNQRLVMYDNNHVKANGVISRIKSLSLKNE